MNASRDHQTKSERQRQTPCGISYMWNLKYGTNEAIMTEKQDGVESGMVLEVLQKGYILNGKVIRPAMVKVSE